MFYWVTIFVKRYTDNLPMLHYVMYSLSVINWKRHLSCTPVLYFYHICAFHNGNSSVIRPARKCPSWRTKSKQWVFTGFLHNRDSDCISNTDFPPDLTTINTKPLPTPRRKGVVRQRLRTMKHKPPLPSMSLDNVRYVEGLKVDERRANAHFLNEHRDACSVISPRLGSKKGRRLWDVHHEICMLTRFDRDK